MFSNNAIQIHGVNVNGVKPTLPNPVRDSIGKDVIGIIKEIDELGLDEERWRRFRQIMGKVSWFNQFHPQKVRIYKNRLQEVLKKKYKLTLI